MRWLCVTHITVIFKMNMFLLLFWIERTWIIEIHQTYQVSFCFMESNYKDISLYNKSHVNISIHMSTFKVNEKPHPNLIYRSYLPSWLMKNLLTESSQYFSIRLLIVTYLKNDILLPKLFWPTVRKNCSSYREFFLKFQAEA